MACFCDLGLGGGSQIRIEWQQGDGWVSGVVYTHKGEKEERWRFPGKSTVIPPRSTDLFFFSFLLRHHPHLALAEKWKKGKSFLFRVIFSGMA